MSAQSSRLTWRGLPLRQLAHAELDFAERMLSRMYAHNAVHRFQVWEAFQEERFVRGQAQEEAGMMLAWAVADFRAPRR